MIKRRDEEIFGFIMKESKRKHGWDRHIRNGICYCIIFYDLKVRIGKAQEHTYMRRLGEHRQYYGAIRYDGYVPTDYAFLLEKIIHQVYDYYRFNRSDLFYFPEYDPYTVFSSIISDMNKWRLKVIRLFEIYLG